MTKSKWINYKTIRNQYWNRNNW